MVTRPPGNVVSYVGREQVAFADPPSLFVAVTVKYTGRPECKFCGRKYSFSSVYVGCNYG